MKLNASQLLARWRKAPRRAASHARRRRMDALIQIPDHEMSPKVRTMLTLLMGELDRMRSELDRAEDRMEALASVVDEDPLVPVLNRRGFLRELERGIAYVNRYSATASLVFMDFDDFKAVNDAYGHAAGDAALTHAAELIVTNIRRSDLVGRLGGDEFALLLHQADYAAAERKANGLIRLVSESPVLLDAGPLTLHISAGVAEIQKDDTADKVLARADQAMYRAKRGESRRAG